MADLSQMLSGLLDNPETLSALSAALDPAAEKEENPLPFDVTKLASLAASLSAAPDNRGRLLSALKPFVDPDKAPRIDKAVQMLRLYELAKAAGFL